MKRPASAIDRVRSEVVKLPAKRGVLLVMPRKATAPVVLRRAA